MLTILLFICAFMIQPTYCMDIEDFENDKKVAEVSQKESLPAVCFMFSKVHDDNFKKFNNDFLKLHQEFQENVFFARVQAQSQSILEFIFFRNGKRVKLIANSQYRAMKDSFQELKDIVQKLLNETGDQNQEYPAQSFTNAEWAMYEWSRMGTEPSNADFSFFS